MMAEEGKNVHKVNMKTAVLITMGERSKGGGG
jgi:hypothetical protein